MEERFNCSKYLDKRSEQLRLVWVALPFGRWVAGRSLWPLNHYQLLAQKPSSKTLILNATNAAAQNKRHALWKTQRKNTHIQGAQKNALSECCWSHSAINVAQSLVAGTPCVWKLIFWLFLTKPKPDQAFPSHVLGENLAPQHSILVMIFGY